MAKRQTSLCSTHYFFKFLAYGHARSFYHTTKSRRRSRASAGPKVPAATAAEAVATTLAKKTSARINYDRLKEILSETAVTAAKACSSGLFSELFGLLTFDQAHDIKRNIKDDVGDEDSHLALSGYDDEDYYDDYDSYD